MSTISINEKHHQLRDGEPLIDAINRSGIELLPPAARADSNLRYVHGRSLFAEYIHGLELAFMDGSSHFPGYQEVTDREIRGKFELFHQSIAGQAVTQWISLACSSTFLRHIEKEECLMSCMTLEYDLPRSSSNHLRISGQIEQFRVPNSGQPAKRPCPNSS